MTVAEDVLKVDWLSLGKDYPEIFEEIKQLCFTINEKGMDSDDNITAVDDLRKCLKSLPKEFTPSAMDYFHLVLWARLVVSHFKWKAF